MRSIQATLENTQKQANEAADMLAQLFVCLIDEAIAEKLALEPKISPYGAKTPKNKVAYTKKIKLLEMNLL